MDFVQDARADGLAFRVLMVPDQWSRQSPVLETASSMSGQVVAEVLDRAIGTSAPPTSITVDHGTGFMSRALEGWAHRRGVQLDFTRPDKPTDNSYIESFNGKLRDECLNVTQFASFAHAQGVIKAWRRDYKEQRPHGFPGHVTPRECASEHQEPRIAELAPLSV